MSVLYVMLVFVFFFLVYFLWCRRKLYITSGKLPGPFAWPIIGNGFYFLGNPDDLLEKIINITKDYSSPMKLWMGPRLVIFIKDPNQLQILMQSSKMSKKSYVYRFLEPFMGKGLFTSAGLQHKTQRKLLQPLFGPTYIESYSYLFQKHADKLAKTLESKVDGKDFDILHYLHDAAFEATMDIMLEDKNEHTFDYKDMPAYVRRFYHIFIQRIFKFWYHLDFVFKFSSYYKEQEHMIKIALTITKEITDSRVPEILERMNDFNIPVELRAPSMLESMMEMVNENPNCLNEEQFRDHMMTFVATSQDTQSSAIAFTLMMLGMHPEIQGEVMSELNEALAGKEKLEYSDLSKLKCMEMCIKESMRLFPLGPFLIRDTIEEFHLDKWVLPKGCTVVLGVYNVHKDPKYWDRPEEFYPKHFLPEATAKRHSYAYLPFSAGPRRCVAQQYSYVNMKIIVSTILQKFKISCDGSLSDLSIMTDVSIRPKNGYLIKICHRR
ncbi:unnamed protein product [Brassicogethes aeneus]|uniref:Cytochrome P450 n=1 Tax=Brassicogethes aeneus TaxID=1431903 RepID=A0A9P0FKW8_BRAAE|nr:unnamed protein product [Brassicogethes aeneus]